MEVHAHSHTPRRKWTHYFWEFLMLFLAVFCGFLAEYQLEHKIEKDRSKEFAKALKFDLMNDTISLNYLKDILVNESEKRKHGMEIINTNKENISIGDLRWMDTTSLLLDYFIPKNVTFEQMKQSGQLRYFKSVDLISSLGQYEWSIKHYLELKNDLLNIYGGLSSEHVLNNLITREAFLKKSAGKPDSLSALKEGYTFDSWIENGKIAELRVNLSEILLTSIYPDLINQAKNILTLLDKEYHLN